MRTTVQLANILCTVLFTPDFLGNRGLDFLLEQPHPKRYMNRKVEGKEASEQFKERGRNPSTKVNNNINTGKFLPGILVASLADNCSPVKMVFEEDEQQSEHYYEG